jgi:hypothetical protein
MMLRHDAPPESAAGPGAGAPLAAFIPPFKVHLCWFDNANVDPRCAAVARELYELLHRPLHDDAIQRPGIEIAVEFGRSLPGLLDALERGGEPRAAVRLVIAALDAAAFASATDRDTIRRRALRRWRAPPAGEVFLPIVVGGAWHAELGASPGIEPITLDGDVDSQRRWELAIDVCIAAGRALLANRQAADPPRPRVLLSYARVDGLDLTRKLAEYFRQIPEVDVWYDTSHVATGEKLSRQLQITNGNSVVLLIRTDRYSESPECANELLAAKQSRAPIVTLLATVDGELAAPAYSGNHRTMNWHPGRELEVAVRCVQAWLHAHHFRASAAAALALAGLPADSDVLPRRPELLDLVQIGRTGRRLVVHPDPPLTDGEATVLRTAYPAVRIATPTTLLGRVLLAQDPEPPLTGTTLAFSLSVAEDLPRLADGRVGAGLIQDHLDDAVYSIVLATLRSGARIAYGGDFRRDVGYARHLVDLHRSYGGLGTRGSAQLVCFLDGGARDGLDPQGIEFDPIEVAAPPGADRFPELRSLLWHFAMREAMAERCTGRILLGGRARPAMVPGDGGYLGPWPGLLEEAWRTLWRDRALYVAGGLGGASGLIARMLVRGEVPLELTRSHHAGAPVADLAAQIEVARRELAHAGAAAEVVLELEPGHYADMEDLASLVLARWTRFVEGDATAWPNGLDIEENRRLFCTTDRTEITYLVFEGMRRVALRPEGELQLALYLGDIATVPKVDGYAVAVTPGVPRVGAYAALKPRMERQLGGPLSTPPPVALEPVGAGELPGSYVLAAQLELPPIGRTIDVAAVDQLACDVAREADRVGLESVACPAFGTTLGLSIADSARAMVRGFRRGRKHQPAKLVFCEIDRARYDQLRDALGAEAVELRAGVPAGGQAGGPVLHVDVESGQAGQAGQARVRVTLYVPEATRPVAPLHEIELPPETWAELQRRILDFDESRRIARMLWRDLMSPEIRDLLVHHADRPLVVLGDDRASGLPWELLMDDRDEAPPQIRSVVRRIALRGSYRAPADQVEHARLRVLVVADPLRDLPNAVPEASAVARSLGGRADVVVECLFHEQATVAAVTARLERGNYDILHYAGHAKFDDIEPDRGGLALADGTLSAAALPPVSPQFVFLSACESGRLRDIAPALSPSPARGSGRSLAEAFLRAGVRAFVGTFYAVDDSSAREFASIVHGQIASGRALGDAIHAARCALYDGRKPDWGNFVLYGDHAMIL